MAVNIRRLNANSPSIEALVEALHSKPALIFCSETGNLPCQNFYSLQGYKLEYNYSAINESDGATVYIRDDLEYSAAIQEIDHFNFLNISLTLNNKTLLFTSVYRCHSISISDFNHIFEKF